MYVYLIKCNDYIKIGISEDVQSRLLYLQTGNPFRLSLLESHECKNAHSIEKKIHDELSSKRVLGEWFSLDSGDIEWIRRMCASGHAESRYAKKRSGSHWRMEKVQNGRYWNWRKGRGKDRKTRYGGVVGATSVINIPRASPEELEQWDSESVELITLH